MASFLKRTDNELADQLDNWSTKLAKYKTDFGLTTEEVKGALADARYFRYVLTLNKLHNNYQFDLNLFLEHLKKNPNNVQLAGLPVLPTPLTIPAAVEAGILDRFMALAKKIKLNNLFSHEIGHDLGIIDTTHHLDLTTLKSVITIIMSAGQPVVKWMKHGLDGIEIWKDTGNGTFVFVDYER